MNKTTLLFRLLVISAVIALAVFGVVAILDNAPPPREKRPPAPAPLVKVLQPRAGTHDLVTIAHGTISAAEPLHIRPQVGGQLLSLHPAFEPGGVIPAGEQIFQIDPTDYRLQLDSAKAAIAKARADLEIEQGKRKVAKEELRLLEGSVKIDASSRSLALRAPQLRQVRAELLLAENELQQTQTQLERTRASMPNDLVVLSRDKAVGEILAPRESIGRVAHADRFWVQLQVPPQLLGRLHTRTAGQPGSTVEVRYQGHAYPAEITRIQAELSSGSRLARVLAEVTDPLGRLPQNKGRPPLLIGSYVEAEINSGRLDNAISIPRSALQDNNRLWVVDAENRLQVRQVTPLYIANDRVYLTPLASGERVLPGTTTGLVPGSVVRVQEQP